LGRSRKMSVLKQKASPHSPADWQVTQGDFAKATKKNK